MSAPPLAGLGVVVTRPAGTGDALAARFRELGADVLQFPAIVIEPLPLTVGGRRLIAALAGFDLAVFISPSAVDRLFDERGPRPWPGGVRAAAVGAGTAARLGRRGVRDVLYPAAGASAAALLAMPALAAPRGRRILIVRGESGGAEPAATLAARGADVAELALYRRAPPADGAPLFAWLARRPRYAIVATSLTALAHLDALGDAAGQALLKAAQLVVPSRRVVKKAELAGYRRITLAADAGDAALTDAVTHWWQSERA